MKLTRCSNCGKKPKFGYSRDKHYKAYLYHLEAGCPNSTEIYHNSEEECAAVWEAYLNCIGGEHIEDT